MGLFDILKRKKSQSELMLKATERFVNEKRDEESSEDIMEKLKNISNTSYIDPRQKFEISNIMKQNQNSDIEKETKTPNFENNVIPDSLPAQQNANHKPLIQEDIAQKIDYSLHPSQKNKQLSQNTETINEIIYDLRTIKTQNDLIIDLLRQIQRKLNL